VVAERLRRFVGAARVGAAGSNGGPGDVGATVSVGVATWPDCPAEKVDDLVAAADRALYQAKAKGRNRCVRASPPRQPAGTPQATPPAGGS
jgi:diguanylate cyclase (GGDEF)-like protein